MKKQVITIFYFLPIILLSQTSKLDSLQNALEKTDNDSLKIEIFFKIGESYYSNSRYDLATEYYIKGRTISEKIGNDEKTVKFLTSEANCLYWNNFFVEADSLYKKAIEIAYKIKDSNLIASSNMGYAMNVLKLGNIEQSIKSLQIASKMCTNDNIRLKGRIYANIGQIEREKNELDSAIFYFNLSKKIWESINDLNLVARTEFELGKTYFSQKKYKKSIAIFRKSIKQDSIDTAYSNKTILVWKYRRISDAYAAIKEYDSAYYFFVANSKLYRKIFFKERVQKIKKIEIKYESEKKDLILQQNKNEIKNKNKLNKLFLLGLVIVFSLMVFVLFILRKYTKQKKDLNSINIKYSKINLELNKQNKKLKELIKYREINTQMIVHDLKNPLNNIISTSKKENPRLYHSAQDMLFLVENILDFSKIESKKFSLQNQLLKINSVINAAFEETKYLFENKGIKFDNLIKNNITIQGDSQILKRVFINLMTNSIKYTESGGIISVKSEIEGDYVNIEVKDTGIGIKQNKLKNIFDIYEHDTNRESETISSTGIGLFFVKNAIEKHRGKIKAFSEVNKGTTFIISLEIKESSENKFIEKSYIEKEIIFTEGEKINLQKIVSELEKTEIFEISKIKFIISKINSNSENINLWKEKLLLSIENYNTKSFNTLLKKVKL